MDSQGTGQTKDLRDWPFLGQLSRSGISQAPSRIVVRIHWSGPSDRRTGERTPRLGFRHRCRPPSGKLRGCAATRIDCPYFARGHPAPLKNIYTQRRWVDFYGGVMAHRRSNSSESDVALLSPDYTDDEIRHIWDGNDFSESYLLAKLLSLDLTEIKELRCPPITLAVGYDLAVKTQLWA